MKKGAFTLIELLVVIAIIALLMALLMPALRLAKDQAAALVCISSLNTLSLAWFTYTIDNDGQLMGGHRVRDGNFMDKNCFPDGFWINPPHDKNFNYTGEDPELIDNKLTGIRRGKIFPYVKTVKVFRCPFDSRLDFPGQYAYCSYSIAGGMNGEEAYRSTGCKDDLDLVAEVFDEIKNPDRKYVFIEEADDRGWNMGSWILDVPGTCWIDPLAPWHNDRSMLGFADGHGEKHRWRSKNTADMNIEQEFGYCPDPGDSDPEDEKDLWYMQRGYVTGKNE
jgi:prepilin-type N-terminal cleavage/methylation domain-containing protein/prepilin-type processing-associated H-X9-DG protein